MVACATHTLACLPLPELRQRLDISGEKFETILSGLDGVAALADPLGAVTLATRLDDGLDLYRVSCPIGVICVIFEARPEAAVRAVARGCLLVLRV
jgi:glutamate-5-semialdehyde dehydrogenase